MKQTPYIGREKLTGNRLRKHDNLSSVNSKTCAVASRRSKQKVRVFSPKTPSKLETSLENFAVEKCSLDPEKDFRDSMTEMIMEEKITRPEELEELLACYLTLNSDEFHDLIIKAFRQVWFDLDQASLKPFHTELHSDECFQD